MTLNVGGVDRIARIIVGIVLLALVVVGPQTWWGLLGIIPLLTGLVRYCPGSHALGVSTRKPR
mgnify:CR=1 FL=1